MSEAGTNTLECRLRQIIKIHTEAGDVTFAETIGTLEIIKADVVRECQDQEEEDDYS